MKTTKALLLVTILVTLGFAGTARAEHYGALRSFLEPGEIAFGLGGGVEFDKWSEVGGDGELFRQTKGYGQLSLGFGKDWALGLRGGVVDMKSVTGSSEFKTRSKPFVGATLGGPLYHGETLAIGPVFQASYVLQPFESDGVEIEDMFKASAAFMAQMEIEGAGLYLGPTFNYGSATVSDVDVELGKPVGWVAGIRWLLPDNWPTDESKTCLDLEIANDGTSINRTDITLALNFTL